MRHKTLLAAYKPTGDVGRFARSSAYSILKLSSRHGKTSSDTASLRHHGGAPVEDLLLRRLRKFFARNDTLERHYRNPPAECLGVTPEKADAEHSDASPRRVQDKILKNIRMPFSRIIKGMYPDSSKKRKGGQQGA
jgi:hypothetical protein